MCIALTLYLAGLTFPTQCSLKLYERSIVVGFMDGNVETVPSRVDDIISNARSFDDTLDSRVLLAKYLTSQAQYADATNGVLIVLSSLGEAFPEEVTSSHVTNEIHAITPMLKGITKDTFLNLPTMTDRTKLNAMKLMELTHLGVIYALGCMMMPPS